MKRSKIFGGILIALLLIASLGYKIIYKKHRNIAGEEASYDIQSSAFIKEFRLDTKIASEKYLNKVIQINGEISEIDKEGITVDQLVYAQFDNNMFSSLTKGSEVKIKGRCIGYDELLETVKLDQCTIIN